MLAIADMAAVAAVLDRGSALELARAAEFLRAISTTTISGRIEEGALQARHRTIDGTLTPARNTGQGIFSCTAKGYPVAWRERTREAGN